MYHLLLPVDENSHRSVAQVDAVTDLPAPEKTTVTLLHVFANGEPSPDDVLNLDSAATARDTLEEADVTVELRAATGDPAEEILAVADDVDADSIVLGGRKRSPLGALLFGSVTQAVTLGTDRPVWVTGGIDPEEEEGAVVVPESVTPETPAATGPFNVKFITRNVFPEMDHEYSFHGAYSYTDVEGYTHTIERRIYVYTDCERTTEEGKPVATVNEDHMVLTARGEPHEIIEQAEREFAVDIDPDASDKSFAVKRVCEQWHENHLDVPEADAQTA